MTRSELIAWLNGLHSNAHVRSIDPRRCAVAKDSGQVVAALVGSSLVYQQCSQCLGTGGWTMDAHEEGKP